MKIFFILSTILTLLSGCETISKKVDNATQKEEERLSMFIDKTESDLKIEFVKPDQIEQNNNNKILVFYDSKFKIKCERRFELNKKNRVVGFSSKNCF